MRILMVMSHPDDEIIFGWPVFQSAGWGKDADKELLMCSSDFNNPERQWCSHRKFILEKICEEEGVKLTCLDNPSEFYRASTRDEGLSRMRADVVSHMALDTYDYIFTHNPLGEYGHLDHKFLFETVLLHSSAPMVYTDICLKSNWPSVSVIPPRVRTLFYNCKLTDCDLDLKFYSRCQQRYEEAGVWTWGEPPVDHCGLYVL